MKFKLCRTSMSPPHVIRRYNYRKRTHDYSSGLPPYAFTDTPLFEPAQFGLEEVADNKWTVNIDSLEQLMELAKITGTELVVIAPIGNVGLWGIEIYDGYRE